MLCLGVFRRLGRLDLEVKTFGQYNKLYSTWILRSQAMTNLGKLHRVLGRRHHDLPGNARGHFLPTDNRQKTIYKVEEESLPFLPLSFARLNSTQ